MLEYAKKHEFKAMAVTDYGTISGLVNFYKTFKGSGIKPILGTTLYICEKDSQDHDPSNEYYSYLTLIAKNYAGWKQLIKIISFANNPVRFNIKPRISIEDLKTFDVKDLIAITGGVASTIANQVFENRKIVYNTPDKSKISAQFKSNWKDSIKDSLGTLRELFKGDLYLECQLNDASSFPAQQILTEVWREIPDIKKIASPNSHYLEPHDCFDHRVQLCTNFKCTMAEVNNVATNKEEYNFGPFFLSNKYGLSTELGNEYLAEEVAHTFEVSDKCEEYDILAKPRLPDIDCPNGMSPEEYLRQLCREGWKNRIASKIDKDKQPIYADRIKRELEVLQGAGLSTYFLMLYDLTQHIKSKNWLLGPARGSAGGCLAAYLTYITTIDPIKFDLIFERFYNAGRNTKDHIAMPDIDIDVPSGVRDEVITYVRQKYGEDSVAQMMTYTNMKGRQAMTDVLHAYGTNFQIIKQITEFIPDEAKIAGDLQDMKEEEGESSIIKWALENRPEKFEEWCHLDNEGNLEGPLAKRFEQAIRLEGTKKTQSKHASGVVVTPGPITDVCPLIYDKSSDGMTIGVEMNDAEALSVVKMDILGVRCLDKTSTTRSILRGIYE